MAEPSVNTPVFTGSCSEKQSEEDKSNKSRDKSPRSTRESASQQEVTRILVPISSVSDAQEALHGYDGTPFSVVVSSGMSSIEYDGVQRLLGKAGIAIMNERHAPFSPSVVTLIAYCVRDVTEFVDPLSANVFVLVPDSVDECIYSHIAGQSLLRGFHLINGRHTSLNYNVKVGPPKEAEGSSTPKNGSGWFMKWGFLSLCAMITGVVIKKASPGPLLQINLNPQFSPKFNFHMWEMLWGRIKEKEDKNS